MKSVRLFLFTLLLTIGLCGCGGVKSTQVARPSEGYLLIDPGHGGMDGGTSAEDGTKEKDVNLAVGLELYDMLLVCGFPVVMTRDADISLHTPDDLTIRSKKVSDMQNRLSMYEKADVILSIHQNHFSEAKYNGTQTFYSPNHPDSSRLALAIQQSVVAAVQPDNRREIKQATDGIYLLSHTQRPAVLVECGFLSNPTERDKLKTPTYRQQLAFAIVGGYWKFLLEQ